MSNSFDKTARPYKYLVPLLFLYMFETSCGDDDQRNKTFTGHYGSGFESSTFTACGEDEFWWAEGKLEKIGDFLDDPANFPAETSSPSTPAKPTQPERDSYKRVFTKLRGDLSEEGSYGHLGAASRLLTVKEVYWVKKQADTDCK